MIYQKLYKRTATGAIQEWYQEVEGDSWRTISGQVDGKKVTSEWHKCEAKNVGKKNATTAEEQAHLEVNANYTKRLELGYFANESDVDNPIHFAPMLAKSYDDYKHKLNFKNGVYSQPKLDGMRCVVTVDGMFSRKGKKVVSAPHIYEALKATGIWETDETFVFDGELYNHDLRDNFEELMSLARQTKPTQADLDKSAGMLQYHIYDCSTGDDTPFIQRLARVSEALKWDGQLVAGCLQIVTTHLISPVNDIDSLYGQYLENGYEGQIIRQNAKYVNKRTADLLKRKEFLDGEFRIKEIVEGVGNRSGIAGRITCYLPDGREFGAGIKGSHEYSKNLLANAEKYVDGTATVRYFTPTADGIPRFPVAVMVYEGKRDT